MGNRLPEFAKSAPVHTSFLGPDRQWHLSFGSLLAGAFLLFSCWAFNHVGSNANKVVLLLATVVVSEETTSPIPSAPASVRAR